MPGCSNGYESAVVRVDAAWPKRFVSYSMSYLLEHHLWPAVPTCHPPRLADRLDGVAPGVGGRQVV
ncbi:MAG TPA: hypothetical protein PKE29_16460 [Phycisphaerales bacterium]|nr:hypothetical protein [Phycisphaerales bacterium]